MVLVRLPAVELKDDEKAGAWATHVELLRNRHVLLYALGIFDDQRRPMMVINYNTDLGDAWEWADMACYPHEFSGFAYRMGLNFIIYSMTH